MLEIASIQIQARELIKKAYLVSSIEKAGILIVEN